MNDAEHWEKVYSSRPPDRLGWYRPHLETPLAWIEALNLRPEDPVIDVGGGASTLVDDLLTRGHVDMTVVDLAESAVRTARSRLGDAAAGVNWLVGDITAIELPRNDYRLWHDRAVFHFLTGAAARQKYRDALLGVLAAGGHFIIGTFTHEAPPRCSGLPVVRYDADGLAGMFGDAFALRRHDYELHVTPGGVEQAYVYCLFQRTA